MCIGVSSPPCLNLKIAIPPPQVSPPYVEKIPVPPPEAERSEEISEASNKSEVRGEGVWVQYSSMYAGWKGVFFKKICYVVSVYPPTDILQKT